MILLYAKNICKRYPTSGGYFYALNKCTLAFSDKGLVAIKGKSGSGKSTLLNLLCGIEKKDEGRILFRGEDVTKRKHPLLGNEASMIFQHYNLIEGESVLYNVSLPLLMRGKGKKKARDLVKHFGLGKLLNHDVRFLSGGEKQRVAICRALATDPALIFADEPTGALDEKSSVIVMEALKDISKKKLVIMVSHNQELIHSYADRVIEIIDGKIVADSGPISERRFQKNNSKYPHRSAWVGRFLLRNLKRNAFKDSMCFLSGVIGFAALLISFGFLVGNMPAMEKEQGNNLCYLEASISKRSQIEIPGSSFTLVKRTRPEKEEAARALEGIESYELVDDYSFFFPANMTFSVDGKVYEPCSFQPVFDITLFEHGSNMLTQGELPQGRNFDECIVNTEFIDTYGTEILGKTINVSSRSVVSIGDKQQELFVDASLKVTAVVKEFGFLNVPRIYYSYPMLRNHLHEQKILDEFGDETSLAKMVADAKEDSQYSSYSSLIFLHDPKEVPKLYHIIEANTEMEITSLSYGLRESFASLSTAFSSSLVLFVGIALVGLALILGMASYSSLIAGKKENAILTVIGAKRKDVLSIYVFEAIVLCVGSAALAFGLSPLLQWLFNLLLQREFDVFGLVNIPYESYLGIPFLSEIILFGFALLLGFLSSFIPMMVNKKMPIVEELRDE